MKLRLRAARCWLFIVVAAPLAIAPALSAGADAPDTVRAEVLFREGRSAVKQGDYETACPKFAESLTLDPAPGTLLNLSDCEDHQGALTAAWAHLRAAIDKLTEDDDRMVIAREHAAALKKRIPHLTVNLAANAPPDMHVRVDAVELEAGSFGTPFAVDPGEHKIVVLAPGRRDRHFDVWTEEGSAETITVAPAPAAPPDRRAAAPAVRPVPQVHAPDEQVSQRTIAFAIGGAGAFATGLGMVLGVLAKSRYDESAVYCTMNACTQPGVDIADDGRSRGDVASFVTAAGVTALAAGALLWFTAPADTGRSSAKTAPVPEIGLGPGGVAARGTW